MDLSSDVNKLCMGCMEKVENKELPCPHCGWHNSAATQAVHQLPPQTILNGKYLTGRVLGEGGFGITYLGWDLNLDMKVAIKEYYPTGFVTRETTATTVTPFSGDKREVYLNGLDKFLVEAKSLAKFYNYPGIVSVKDFFKENGTAYIVMEYVDGITLKQYFVSRGGRMPADTVFDLVKPLMSSLSQMHKAGIIHRDISPDNLMLTPEGTLKLLDFGAARAISADGAKSLSVILKPGYAPEEQYRTRGVQGPWTDVYALCATIYKAITGETPPEALDRLHEDTLVPPSQKGAAIRPSMEAALLKGMSVLQKDRYDSIASLYSALYGENQNSSPLLKAQTEIITGSRTAASSEKLNTDDASDKTVPLDVTSEKTLPLEKISNTPSPAPAPLPAPVTKFSKGAGLIFLVLFSMISFLLKNYEADLFLWAIAALNIGYCVLGLIRKSPTSSLEKALAAGVRSGLVILLTVIYLGDNSRAFGYGGDPDPGFALGYGASLVIMAFLLITAGYDIISLIKDYKNSDGLSEAQKKQTGIYRTAGISAFALAFIISAGTLFPLIDDVQQTFAIREKEEDVAESKTPEPSPSIPAESKTPEPTQSALPSPTVVEIGSSLAPMGNAPSDPSISGNTNPGSFTWNADVFCYKMQVGGKETLQISSWDLSDTRILVSDGNSLYTPQIYGDWVYYHTQPGIYRIRPDGSNKELLANTEARSFLVYGDKIYYTADDQGLLVMNLDGSDVKLLCGEDYSYIGEIRDNTIFYNTRGSMKAVRLDGSSQTLLTEKEPYVNDGTFYKGDLFYRQWEKIYRIKLQEGNKEEVLPVENITNFKLYKDRIYYFDMEAGSIKSCDLDGSDQRIISSHIIEDDQRYINIDAVTDDWIYYSHGTCEFSRRITHDGSTKQNIGVYN